MRDDTSDIRADEIDDDLEELDLDELRRPFESQVVGPAEPEPDLLPFGSRSPEDFEKIILQFCEAVDGVRGARLYGRRGQRQHGIDLHGRSESGDPVTYQMKRYAFFSDADLEAAVEEFAKGTRPFGARVFVVCVSAACRDTAIDNKLDQLRKRYPDLDLRLYDATELSNKLKERPDVVHRLFGKHWADAFCRGVAWSVPVPLAAQVVADTLLRGPVVALGLADALANAEALAPTDPSAAAREVSAIVSALRTNGYAAQTVSLERQLAELHVQAGDPEAAAAVLMAQAWNEAESGKPHWDGRAAGRLRALAESHGIEVGGFLSVVDAIEAWYAYPSYDLSKVEQTLAGASDSATYAQMVCWVSETALALRDIPTMKSVLPRLADLIAERASQDPSEPLHVRLRLAMADLDGDWESLVRDARAGRLLPANASMVFARRGRDFGRRERLDDATTEYAQAIQQACVAGMTHEAASCVRSSLEVRLALGDWVDDPNEIIRMGMSIDKGSDGHFPGRDAEDAGAAALANNDLIGALRWFRTGLRHAVIRGDWRAEHALHQRIAKILADTGDREVACRHAIFGHATKLLKECMPASGYVDLFTLCSVGFFQERAVALQAAALEADLVPDELVGDYVSVALAGASEPDRGLFGPHVRGSAWKLLGELAPRMSNSESDALLDLIEPLIEREPNHYRFEDDDIAAGLAGALQVQGASDRACALVGRVIEQGGELSRTTLRGIYDSCSALPPPLERIVRELADGGHAGAIDVLIDVGIDHPAAVAQARDAVSALKDRKPDPPGVFSIGTGLPAIASRARVLGADELEPLVTHALGLATSDTLEVNRADGAIAVRALSDVMSDSDRQRSFAVMLDVFDAPGQTPTDPALGGPSHPLSSFRVDLDRGGLHRQALRAAACLATSPEEKQQVLDRATGLLMQTDESDWHAAAHAIHGTDPSTTDFDPTPLAAHPARWARQLGALLAAASDPPRADLLLRLARDEDVGVREAVCDSLAKIAARDADLHEELAATLRDDPNWSVRRKLSSS